MCGALNICRRWTYPAACRSRARDSFQSSKSLFKRRDELAPMFSIPPTPCAPACLPARAFGYAALRQNYVLLFSMVCGIVYVLQK